VGNILSDLDVAHQDTNIILNNSGIEGFRSYRLVFTAHVGN